MVDQTSLPRPVKEVLHPAYPDVTAADRVWRNVSTPERRYAPIIGAALAVAAGVTGAIWWSIPERRGSEPLVTTAGDPLETALATHGPLSLSDGSTIWRSDDSELVPLVNEVDAVRFLLEQGEIRLDIPPGGERQWTIECGLARVSVLGTRFTVARREHVVEVAVQRGAVLIESMFLEQGVRRLKAGESVTISSTRAVEQPTIVDPPAEVVAKPRLRKHSRKAMKQKPMSDLLQAADVARGRGDLEQASTLLAKATKHHPEDPRAALAHFTRGRIELDRQRPAVAASAFQAALRSHIPRALEEDVWVRLAEAYAKAGDAEISTVEGVANDEARRKSYRFKLRATIERYQQRFPNGRRADEMARWSRDR